MLPSEIKLDELPAYRAAVQAETEAREAAFLDAPGFICGIEVLPLTIRRFLWLTALKTPFTGQGVPSLADCGIVLWMLSPAYRDALRMRMAIEPWTPGTAGWLFNRRRKRFLRQIRQPHLMLVEGILKFMAQTFEDSPGGSDRATGFRPSYFAAPTYLVAEFAKAFHWSEESILEMPLTRAFQYQRLLSQQLDSKTPLFNPSDKVRSKEISALLAQN